MRLTLLQRSGAPAAFLSGHFRTNSSQPSSRRAAAGAGMRLLSSARPLPAESNHTDEEDDQDRNKKKKYRIVVPQQQHVDQRRRESSNGHVVQQSLSPCRRPLETVSLPSTTEPPFQPNEALSPSIDVPPTTISYYNDGCAPIPITTHCRLVKPQDDVPRGIWPCFRLMDESGEFRHPSYDNVMYDGDNQHQQTQRQRLERPSRAFEHDQQDDPHSSQALEAFRLFLSQEIHGGIHKKEFLDNGLLMPSRYEYSDTNSTNTLLRAYTQIVRLRQMDEILLNAQRQGRISFYMTCRGEEAIHMGAASALELQDTIFAQYREQGVLMWRGFTLDQFTNQCFGNAADLGKGRQMPVHYGSRALNYHTISSPLGTQLPQAAGAAYRLKLQGKPNVAVCFFGEGCASTTDFHAAMNFAATLSAPVLFVCRNNGFAISTPSTDQYAGDGVVSRAPGYGMAAIRVDGNDVFAVHAAVREAKRYALEHHAPVMLEAMTYRQGHHSTSDDSTRYRSAQHVQKHEQHYDPLVRLRRFLQLHNWMDDEQEAALQNRERMAVLQAMERAERMPPPPLMDGLFSDVYQEMPPHLQRQQEQLQAHMRKYPKRY